MLFFQGIFMTYIILRDVLYEKNDMWMSMFILSKIFVINVARHVVRHLTATKTTLLRNMSHEKYFLGKVSGELELVIRLIL